MNSYGGVVLVFLCSIAGCERSTTNEAAGDRGSTPVASSMPSSMPNMPNEAAEDAGAVDAADSGPAEDAGLPGAAAANHSEPLGPCPAEMAYLAAGSFKTGESGRRVSVTAFCLDKREVTVAHYMQCVKEKKLFAAVHRGKSVQRRPGRHRMGRQGRGPESKSAL